MQVSGRGRAEPLPHGAHTSFRSAELLGAETPGSACRTASPGNVRVLTTFLRGPDAELLRRVLPAAQPEGLPIRKIEEHFHPWLGSLQIHLGLLGAPHFSTESHGIAVLFYI